MKRLLSFCFYIFIALAVKGQTAGFTADVTAGCAPLVVHFTNTSTGATSYSWDLGNGTTSALTNASGSFLNSGTFIVKLTAYNGASSSVKTLTVTVYEKPNVAFTVANVAVCNGSPVQFTNASASPSGGSLTYNWNFGDGSSSTDINPSHTYPAPGYYSITLDVKNAHGCDSTLIKNAYIHVTTAPLANFSLSSSIFCKAPAHELFTDLTTGSGGYTYLWTFGDGHTSKLANPAYDYTAGGKKYTVTLAVTDVNGCKDTIKKDSVLRIDQVGISGPAKGCIFYPSTFFNTTPDTTTLSSAWNFGDGLTSTATNPVHSWNSKGPYLVKLSMTDGGCTDTASKLITIFQQPPFNLTDSPAIPCPAPVNVYFNAANAPGGATYSWAFDDGTTSVLANPVHTFYNNGFLNYSIVVTDTNGCKDSVNGLEKIYDLQVLIQTSTVQGCLPLSILFKDTIFTNEPNPPGPYAYPDTVASYSWDFGDGSPTSSLKSPVHIYTTSGIYQAHLTITTANGCSASDAILIKSGKKPIITSLFDSPTHVCFNNNSIILKSHVIGDTPLLFYWYSGADILNEPPIVLLDSTRKLNLTPGIYHPKLVVSNYGCFSDTARYPVIVIDSPQALFPPFGCGGIPINCDTPTMVYFPNASVGATSYLWKFTDGTTDTVVNPIHDFHALGLQSATIIAYNSRSGCTDTVSTNVLLDIPAVTFMANDTIICKGDSLRWQAVFSGADPIVIAWHFGDGKTIPPPLPNADFSWCPTAIPVHDTTFGYTFKASGTIPVTLEILDQHYCIATHTVNFHVSGAVDTFSVTPPVGCRPLNVNFTDLSTDVPGFSIVSRKWDFGDNSSGTVASATTSHLYTTAGMYNVQLITTNNAGCSDTLTRPQIIQVLKPTAAFSASTLTSCIGDNVTFISNSMGIGTLRLKWSFGDGGTDTVQNPVHAYLSAGSYNVRLIITDSLGCPDTLIQAGYIDVIKPHAAFIMSDSTAVCPPLTVIFTNTTTGGSTYLWDLGNGNTSIATIPTNLYSVPGIYTVTLVATNSIGCSDTVAHQVQVYGYAGTFSYAPLLGCSPMTVNFTANVSNVPTIIFDYSDGNVTTGSAATTASHVYSTPGRYIPKVILSNGATCQISSTGIDTIKVDSLVVHYALGQSKVCEHDTVQLLDSSYALFSKAASWFWTFNGSQTAAGKVVTHAFNTSGRIPLTLIVTSSSGCRDTLYDSITVNGLPTITAHGDTVVCVGDSALLSAAGGLSYNWQPADSVVCNTCAAAKAAPKVAAVYIVTGKNNNGCENGDSVKVGVKTKTISVAGSGATICEGDSVQLSDTGAQQYNWYPPEGLSDSHISNPVARPVSSIVYTVVAKLGACAEDSNYVTIYVNPKPTVRASGSGTIFAGSTAQLQATGSNIVIFLWSPAASLSCDSCSDPVSKADSTTTYTVTGITKYGCEDSDKVTVHVLCDHSQVFIPNTFTPNGDGQNDVFFPRGVGLARINSFRIYNRWGQIVFQKDGIDLNDEKGGWDGTFNGASPKPDVYIYFIDAICQTGEPISWKGDVTLIR